MRRSNLPSILVATSLVAAASTLGACNGPRTIHESPVLVTGERVPDAMRGNEAALASALAAREAQRAAADSTYAAALATCVPTTCAALARGEVALGMTEQQVLAASRSAPAAWSARRGGTSAVLVPATLASTPADAVGELAMVQLANGRVSAITYREASGYRVVQSAADATPAGRAAAIAQQLVAEGDQLAAAGDRVGALDRYDRALVLQPADAMLQYRVATLLDQQLRPVEALMRYQRFLLQLDVQRIEAQGNANAKLAEAIARARERVIVLEKQSR